jgi:hypothetical protein
VLTRYRSFCERLFSVNDEGSGRAAGDRLPPRYQPPDVGTHVEHIMRKLGARSRAQVVALAYRDDLLKVPKS